MIVKTFMKKQKYDFIIGIPSYNNEKTIGFVRDQVILGLKKYYPKNSALILNVDGGSTDDTRKVFLSIKTPKNIYLESKRYSVISGKGMSLHKVFEYVVQYQSHSSMVVDSDLRSISPEWVKSLLDPIMSKKLDLVTPIYSRDRFDGTITKNLAHPMIAALYNYNVPQPIGGDFGFSTPLAKKFLTKNIWDTDVVKFGIDIFMTTVAVAENFKVGAANLGVKIHDPKDPRGLGPMFVQVSSTIFDLMKEYEGVWKNKTQIKQIPILKTANIISEKAPKVKVDIDALIGEFKKKYKYSRNIYEFILYQEELDQLDQISQQEKNNFYFPIDLWTRLVYDFASEYVHGSIQKKNLLDAFMILYYARVASYILEVKSLSESDLDKYLDKTTNSFIKNRKYLFRRWKGIRPVVEEWFKKNTFYCKDFEDIKKLVRIKNKKQLTIGLCLPAKNEEATIGKVVKTLKPLKDKFKLLDEIILIDSCSEDNTVKIAQKEGIDVFSVNNILPSYQIPTDMWGKGENLWKSIYALNTDIILWVDTDIENIHPRFIYGLVGPMLENDHLGFVKAFYRRPLKVDNKLQPTGGGRVTELTARPLINTFYPDLSQILQPLSGEMAIRRELAEKIPLTTNYALETCMLIDIYTKYGLDVIGQSDLLVRVHRNNPLHVLSKLSFGIMQAVINRLHLHGKVKLLQEPKFQEGRYNFSKMIVIESQRQPIYKIPEYKEKFKNRKPKWKTPKRK